jgi:hypothetical protein
MFVAQGCQEGSNIFPLGTAHIEECLLKIVLGIYGLCGELEDEAVPPCLRSGEGVEPDHDGIGKSL